MIRKCDQPECFKDFEDGFMYLECYNDKPYAYIAFYVYMQRVMFHLEVVKWSHNTLKHFYLDWAEFKDLMKANDITEMVITKEGLVTESYAKFLKKFGLSPPRQVAMATYDLR